MCTSGIWLSCLQPGYKFVVHKCCDVQLTCMQRLVWADKDLQVSSDRDVNQQKGVQQETAYSANDHNMYPRPHLHHFFMFL